jgi:chromosome segregation ATPase
VQGEAGNVTGESRPAQAVVNPNLSANLRADYEALQNDMEQARELAADFQRQLAGKSNEFAQLKQLFDKATADLSNLQAGIVELRAERHRLANESMRATAFQAKLAQVTSERDRLRVELEHVRKALEHSAREMAAALRERDAQIASLVIELVTAKEAVEVARRELQAVRPGAALRFTPTAGQPGGSSSVSSPSKPAEKIELGEEFIDIAFDR